MISGSTNLNGHCTRPPLWSPRPGVLILIFFFSSRRRHTRCLSDWSSDVCSSDLATEIGAIYRAGSGFSLLLSPTNSGTFSNGFWSGNITVQAPGTNIVLRARDAAQHLGESNPFNQIGRASCRERV